MSAAKDDPINALVRAVFKSKPPVLEDGVKVGTESGCIPTVTMTFVMTPGLVAAWGDECRVID